MLPHKHFLIAALFIIITVIAFFSQMEFIKIIKWVIVGGFVSMIVDLDIYAIVFLKAGKENKLKLFRNPLEIYRNYEIFIDTVFITGVAKIALITHLVFPIFIILISYYLFFDYFMPIAIGVASHIISDLPNFKRLKL